MPDSEWEREIAVATFNRTWDLLDQPARTAADDDEMLVAVFASRFHWERVGTSENIAVADNQVARVAAAVGDGPLALRFAERALTRTEAEGWTDWRLASALEVCARASAAAGHAGDRDAFVQRARRVLDTIDDPEDRQIIEDQLATVPEV